MAITEKYKYTISLKYMKKDTKEYVSIDSTKIDYMIIDREYDINNMPVVYIGLNLHDSLVKDMIKNYNSNLINLEVYKFKYDDDNFIPRLEEVYIRDQCTYLIIDTENNGTNSDLPNQPDSNEEDYVHIDIGLMKVSLINDIRTLFNQTFNNTTLTNAVCTITNHIPNILIEPLSYGEELLNQISIYKDSVSKSIEELNNVKVLYSSPYRFFMDFDITYLLSSKGMGVPRKGEKILAVLICIKKPADYMGMDDGMYVNKTQKNYQINVCLDSTSTYNDILTDKIYNNIMAITNSGEKTQVDLNIDKSVYGSTKTKTVYIPNDNTHMAENIKAQTENGGVQITLCKESIDTTVLSPNHRIIIKHTDDNQDKDGDYLMTRKQEIFVRDAKDFILSTIVSLKKIR